MRHLRRLVAIGLLLLPVLALAYLGYWSWMARQIQQRVASEAALLRQAGYVVAWRNAEVEGFPFFFRLVLDQPNFEQNLAAPTYALYADVLRARAQPFDLDHWKFESGGDTGIDVSSGPENSRLSVRASNLGGTLANEPSGSVLEVNASDLTAQTTAAAGALPIARGEAHLFWPATPATADATWLQTNVALHEIRLRRTGPLGYIISELDIGADVRGRLPPGRWPDALARWRDSGGHVDLQQVRTVWGPLNLSGNGTLSLDRNVQPTGSGTTTIVGLGPTLDALVETGTIPPNSASLVKTGLSALSLSQQRGGAALNLPFRIADSQLFLGPVRLLDLPRINWQ